MAVMLEITKATKSYERGAPALRDINLKVEDGELVALIDAPGPRK
jgi:ABC-type phosphate/phosphonate transport system ATPase subunit